MNSTIEKSVTEIRSGLEVASLESLLINKSAIQNNGKISLGINLPTWKGPLTVKQFKFGQSNPTFLIIDADNKLSVLRRKPFPNDKLVSKSAHSIEREFFIINGINQQNQTSDKKVPVPETYMLCEDESVIGYVFYMMEFVEGSLITNPELPGVSNNQKSQIWNSIMETLTAIHSLDADKLIESLPDHHFPQFKAKPSKHSYFERQMKTLAAVLKKQSEVVKPIPGFDEITRYILRNGPKDPEKKMLIHGDFKIDNLMFNKERNKVIAVLDWELCTFGHPLFDLANLLQPFQLPNKLNLLLFQPYKTKMGRENPQSLQVIEDMLHLYYKRLGFVWDKSDNSNNPSQKWTVGFVFGLARLSVISQGIAMRVQKGSASSANAAAFAGLYPYLAKIALEEVKPTVRL